MSEHVPTTERIRSLYYGATAWNFSADRPAHLHALTEKQAAEFDRWLASVKAEAWDEGKSAGIKQTDWEYGATPREYIAANPYRENGADS